MKKIGIGYENYKEFIEQDLYYVDKTALVRDVLDKGGKVTLITRPRRFGKTLGLSMLRTFFEREYDHDGTVIDKRRFFEGMKIMNAGDEILSKMGQYPVIKLSLKEAKQPDFVTAFMKIRNEVISEYGRHSYLRDSSAIDKEERKRFEEFSSGDLRWRERSLQLTSQKDREDLIREEIGLYEGSLKLLSELLRKHHGKKVIILLDEYDVPLENAWFAGFYDAMIGFIRSFFESALKTNDALEFAVITGCLRISKESIFTGMNHLEMISVRSADFSEGFGFTQQETEKMLADYGMRRKVEEVREWYDGYLFGSEKIYNPWSVTKYVKAHVSSPECFPEPYWSNTSSNSIIKELVYQADESIKEELDTLIAGGTIEKRIHEDITYADIYESEDNLWNFLFFTGYLRKVSERRTGEDIHMTMCIPNLEIRSIYRNQIREWFDRIVKKTNRSALYQAIVGKDTQKMGDFLTELLGKSISVFDSAESFYHGFFLSLLFEMPRYSVKSNREEGDGRPDIILYPNRPMDPVYLFECKVRKKYNEMQDGLEEAFEQIRERRYVEGVLDDGYAGVVSYGICFCKKSCIVSLYHP